MTEQPKTVVCASCKAKFHVPDELIRGKLVKFRCRKCGSAIDVDGRRSARPPAVPVPPPAPAPTGIDTPATFSQRTLPPPRPPVALSKSAPNLHPWPEPPRTRTTTAPIALGDGAPPEESVPRLDGVRDRSNRAPKIAAIVSLLIAAGLSGFGLAMRASPSGPVSVSAADTPSTDRAESPSDPRSGAVRAQPAEEAESNEAHTLRSPTRVTDLPPAGEGVGQPPGADPKAAEGTSEAVNAAAPKTAARGATVANNEAPSGASDPGAAPPTPAVAAPPAAAPNAAVVPGAAPSAAAVVPPAPTVAAAAPNPTAVPPGTPLAAAGAPPPAVPTPAPVRAKSDFNTQAAREALEDAAGRAGKCRNIDTPSGTARVAVTFAPSGHVTNAVIESGPFVGTAAGSCVASKFRSAKVPPFSGESVLVRKNVPF